MSLISFQNNLLYLRGYNFIWYKNMNSTFTVIRCFINFLMNVSSKGLKDYLSCASIYNGTSPKKKTDLIEMIVYGCMTGTLNKKDLEDIKIKEAIQILNKNNITIDSLPGYGNMNLQKNEIKPYVMEKTLTQ